MRSCRQNLSWMPVSAELASAMTEAEIQQDSMSDEAGEPIRLFDRKRTRARKQKSANGTVPEPRRKYPVPQRSSKLRWTKRWSKTLR